MQLELLSLQMSWTFIQFAFIPLQRLLFSNCNLRRKHSTVQDGSRNERGILSLCNICVFLSQYQEEKVKDASRKYYERGSLSLGGLSLFVHLCTSLVYIYFTITLTIPIFSRSLGGVSLFVNLCIILVHICCRLAIQCILYKCFLHLLCFMKYIYVSFSVQFATRYIMCAFFLGSFE